MAAFRIIGFIVGVLGCFVGVGWIVRDGNIAGGLFDIAVGVAFVMTALHTPHQGDNP